MRNRAVALVVLLIAATMVMGRASLAAGGTATQAAASQPVVPHVNRVQIHALPVQYAGRVMPVDTLSRQIIWRVHGTRDWPGGQPTMVILSWMWQWETWKTVPIVRVGDRRLRDQIGLPVDREYLSYAELAGNERLTDLRQAAEQGTADEDIRAARRVGEQLQLLEALSQEKLIRCIPPAVSAQGDWVDPEHIASQAGLDQDKQEALQASWRNLRRTFLAGQYDEFGEIAVQFSSKLAALGSPAWPQEQTVQLELLSNILRPAQKGLWCALAAIGVALVSLKIRGRWQWWVRLLAWGALLNSFSLLTLTLVLRWKFLGHLPVRTWHEATIAGAWAILAAAVAVMYLRRWKTNVLLPAAAAVAAMALFVVDMSPLWFGP